MENNNEFDFLLQHCTAETIEQPEIQEALRKLTLEQREEIALRTKSRVYYYNEEVPLVQSAEEQILEKVMPDGYTLKELPLLNGLNIGAGGRTVTEYVVCLDFNRGAEETTGVNGIVKSSFLSNADNLPFKDSSMDYAIALHILEHCADPVAVIKEWLRVLKPGGKLGVVIPNWKYNWSAANDDSKYGHRWNSSPESAKVMLDTHFADKILFFNTYNFKLSFDFILKKPGTFVPFQPKFEPTGKELGKGIEKDYYTHKSKLYFADAPKKWWRL
jgi:SAM-dependent methyltransferase